MPNEEETAAEAVNTSTTPEEEIIEAATTTTEVKLEQTEDSTEEIVDHERGGEEKPLKSVILNQSAIGELQPGTLIQCNKCWETFLATEFQDHFNSAHEDVKEQVVIAHDPGYKKCAICQVPARSKKEYLIHYYFTVS